MSDARVIALPGNTDFAKLLARHAGVSTSNLDVKPFPDGETHLTFGCDIAGRSLALVCTLVHPNAKILPLLFAAETARELGAARVGLVAPYLAYMRQDQRFRPGEAVTSRLFSRLVSEHFDWLVTVDPHLHRIHALSDVYTIPATSLHAAPLLAAWIAAQVKDPVIVGPDAESAQWAGDVAARAKAPFTVLSKTRAGDRSVSLALPDAAPFSGRTPVLLDDIISTGETLSGAIALVRQHTAAAPVVVVVHGIFAEGAIELLQKQGVRVVTTNTIAHASNGIDVSAIVAQAMCTYL